MRRIQKAILNQSDPLPSTQTQPTLAGLTLNVGWDEGPAATSDINVFFFLLTVWSPGDEFAHRHVTVETVGSDTGVSLLRSVTRSHW